MSGGRIARGRVAGTARAGELLGHVTGRSKERWAAKPSPGREGMPEIRPWVSLAWKGVDAHPEGSDSRCRPRRPLVGSALARVARWRLSSVGAMMPLAVTRGVREGC